MVILRLPDEARLFARAVHGRLARRSGVEKDAVRWFQPVRIGRHFMSCSGSLDGLLFPES